MNYELPPPPPYYSTAPATDHSRLWVASIIALAAANAADAASSIGRQELNPILQSRDGRFMKKGILIKTSAVGGSVLLQYLIKRSGRRWFRFFTVINASTAATAAFAAIHNIRQK